MITDVHAHVWPDKAADKAFEYLSKYYKFPLAAVPTLNNFLKILDKAEIDRAVIASVATRPDQVDHINKWLFSIKSERIVKFAAFHPFYDKWRDELKRIKDNASGLKIHPEFQNFFLDDEKVFPLYEQIQEMNIPVMFHCGYEFTDLEVIHAGPDRIANVLKRFPAINFIAAHMGGYQMWETESLRKHVIGNNVYIDTSSAVSVMDKKCAYELLEKHDINKVLFGSDFPMGNPIHDVEVIKSLNLDKETVNKIMSSNFENLLKA